MSERQSQLCIVVSLTTLVLGFLGPSLVLGQGAPDIVWSRSDHTQAINSVMFSQDGSLVASGSSDGTIRIWQASNGNAVGTITNGTAEVLNIVLGTNGTLVSWDGADVLRVWQVPGGSLIRTQAIPSLGGYAFSAKGELFAAGGDIWRVSDGTRARAFTPTAYPMPAFSPDGEFLAIGLSLAEEYHIDVWRLADGSLLRAITNCCLSLGGPPVFTPDSEILSAATAPYHITEFWRIDDGGCYGNLYDLPTQYNGNVYTKLLAFTPDSQLITTVNSFDWLLFWHFKPGRNEAHLLGYDQETTGIKTLAISPKGDTFTYGRQDGRVILARVPLFITEARQSAAKFVLQWAGGSGLYQLQQRTNMAVGIWESVGGPTTNTLFTNAISGQAAFFRVLSLPN